MYDKAGHLVFSQDGLQRTKSEWVFYLYDVFGRLIVQGICKNSNAASATGLFVTCAFTPTDTGLGNSRYASSFSLVSPIVHLVNYYDNYKFLALSGYADRTKYPDGSVSANPTGFLTGSMTTLLDNGGKLHAVTYYDMKGRPVRTTTSNHLGGYETFTATYTFTGKPVTVRHEHVHSTKDNAIQTELTTYAYDHAERLLKTTYKLNANPPVALSENGYDNLGRLVAKKQHGTIVTSYGYNIRNWLTGVTSPQFTQNLYYTAGNATPCYNGNISSMTWKSGGESTVRGYKFAYDGLNRLTSAMYGEGTAINANAGRFNESISLYDMNGNVKALQRSGKASATAYGVIDNLTFSHNGNQLKTVADAATDPLFAGAFNFVDGSKGTGSEYIYDANGNLIQDFNKKIAKIQYNNLNLPNTLQFANGNTTGYLYSADGVKRRVIHQTAVANVTVPMGSSVTLAGNQVAQTITTDYCDNAIYENEKLSKILTPEGYVTLNGTTPTYHYYLKDHQGNNRVVVCQNSDQTSIVEQVNHYYPFGGLFAEGLDTSKQAYKYNGKELDRMHGLDWYDYSARMMDSNSGQFMTVDPLCEEYYSISPYVYCTNNPVRYIDPTGMYYDGYTVDEYANFTRVNDEGGREFDVIYAKAKYSESKRKDYDATGKKTGLQISKNILDGDRKMQNMSNKSIKMPVLDMENKPTGKTKANHAYEIKTDAEASTIMIFMDKNTKVEWGNTLLKGADGQKVNLLTTSHEEATISAGRWQVDKYVNRDFQVLRDDHIHPTPEYAQPSGNHGDAGYGRYILRDSPQATFRILNQGKYYPYIIPPQR